MKGIIVLYDKDKNKIKKVSLLKASYKENLIINKSIEMFNESEPCIIYKTMCINKLGVEKQEYLSKLIDKEKFYNINDKLCEDFVFDDNVKYVKFM